MAQLQFLWVIHTTSKADNANTDDLFSLILRNPRRPSETAILNFPTFGHNERELRRTDEYEFDIVRADLNFSIDIAELRERDIGITIRGNNAWLPSSIWVFGEDAEERRQLLAAQPSWLPELWFSTDPTDVSPPRRAQPTWFLDVRGPLGGGGL